MRFHALLVVRDEADVISELLAHLLSWADSLHIYDTGSSDGTWDLITDAARSDPRIHPLASEPTIAEGDTRGYLLHHARASFRSGDWFARVDADEFYHHSPREWIPANTARHESRVYAQQYEFVLTHDDLASHEQGRYTRAVDTALPVQRRMTRFVIEPVVEARFFRFRRNMHWAQHQPNPWHPGLPAHNRIPVRHYRWRTFEQMQSRCINRILLSQLSIQGVHWQKDWRDWLWDAADPRLQTWTPGAKLPHHNDTNHLGPPHRRLAQHLLYRSHLPTLADLARKPWPANIKPRPIPPHIDAQLRAAVTRQPTRAASTAQCKTTGILHTSATLPALTQ